MERIFTYLLATSNLQASSLMVRQEEVYMKAEGNAATPNRREHNSTNMMLSGAAVVNRR